MSVQLQKITEKDAPLHTYKIICAYECMRVCVRVCVAGGLCAFAHIMHTA